MNGQNSRAKQQIAAALGGAPSPFPDGRPDPARSLASMAADLHRSEQAANSAARQKLLSALKETWPAQLAKTAYEAATLPGDVYAGRVNPMSDEGIGRSFELAGLMTLGAGTMPAGKNELRAGIKAYHGSPHDFDRFDMSKIGTGEGAQAYGHGLYFAQSEDVARSYRSQLSEYDWSTPESAARALLSQANGNRKTATERAAILAARSDLSSAQQRLYAGAGDLLLSRPDISPAPTPGRMFEVELNTTPDRLLDWDRPLREQSNQGQKFLDQELSRYLGPAYGGQIGNFEGKTAGEILANTRGRMLSAPETSTAAKKTGIDGIQYLDAGSRAAGDGSRNYVMFNDKLINILRKYGVATTAALPAAGLAELGITAEEARRSM